MKYNEALFRTEQVITYLGNKRKLLPYIEAAVKDIQKEIGKDKLVCADLFSGSGVVARMLKPYSSTLITNDMELYSKLINDCYLTNEEDFDIEKYQTYKDALDKHCETLQEGVIAKNYAPKNDADIEAGERAFYTTRNAQYIDTAMDFILNQIETEYQKFFIAPLLYEASVHANTSGIFKSFYKNSTTGKGQFGGNAKNCLERITGEISIKKPVFSEHKAKHISLQGDTNEIVADLTEMDVAYLDPPYNQHGYGSNYFMLNTIAKHKLGKNLSKVSGIPNDWNRSDYNRKDKVLSALEELVGKLNSRYIIISYNSDGFITKTAMEEMLKKYGDLNTVSVKYNTYRGSRNLNKRDIYVNEYLFVLKKESKAVIHSELLLCAG